MCQSWRWRHKILW